MGRRDGTGTETKVQAAQRNLIPGAPKEKRPAEYLRYDGKAFAQFLADSLDMGAAHIVKTRRIGAHANLR